MTNYVNYKPKLSEHSEQANFFSWLLMFKEREFPEVHPLFFAVSNGANLAGGQRQKAIQMSRLKAEGFTPGVADTLFLSGRGGYLGLALEFKTRDRQNEKDGGLSEGQREFLESCKLEGYKAQVAYGSDEAEQIVSEYLAMPKTQALVYAALRALEKDEPDEAMRILQQVVLTW